MEQSSIVNRNRILIPVGAGLLGSILLTAVYFGIVSWAESLSHAVELFWQDRWIVFPVIIGFGIQAGLYTILKLKLYLPINGAGPRGSTLIHTTGASMGASGATSTVAMVACCAHHVADVLPILGLTAAATFLAKYRLLFMGVGLGTTLLGIGYLLIILIRERQRSMPNLFASIDAKEAL